MNILLVAATPLEIAPFVTRLRQNNGRWNGCNVEVLITGIGQTAAAWAISHALRLQKPQLMIQAGIAGSFSADIALGTVVAVAADCFGDLGMEEKGDFSTLFQQGLADADAAPFVNGWLPNTADWLKNLDLPLVKAVTVNKVSDSILQTRQLSETFQPGVESMEGAALHYVCLRENIPFLQLRSVSNEVGERDKSNWQISEAVHRLNHELERILPIAVQQLAVKPERSSVNANPPATLTLGFSPCPNDTFIFDALVNGKIDTGGLRFDVVLEDVETLNRRALEGHLDITKLSYGVLPQVLDRYKVLNSGSALGRGVGPLLICKDKNGTASFTGTTEAVAIPGEHTTAHLLFSLAYPNAVNKIFMRYDEIEQAVLDGKVAAGVIIHENRFTYRDKGLHLITELGNYWETLTGQPIPLGGIVIKNNIPPALQQQVDALIRRSVHYAFAHYPAVTDYVRRHAQEMSDTVMRQHIDLYVNDYSLNLGPAGKAAVERLLQVQMPELTATNSIFVLPML